MSPTRTSIHAPMASRFGPGWRSVTASQLPIGAGCAASPGAHVPPELHRGAVVHLDQVEHAVEVEVGQGGAAARGEAQDAGGLGALR